MVERKDEKITYSTMGKLVKTHPVKPQTSGKKIEELKVKLQELEEIKIPEILARRAEAASWGDLSENAGFEQANRDLDLYQSMVRSLKLEIKHLEEGK